MPPVNGYYTLIISSCRRLKKKTNQKEKKKSGPPFSSNFLFVNFEIDPQECARIALIGLDRLCPLDVL
jgi:hypothetical protein